MAKYRKKPVEIDAIQWTGENQREMFDFLTNGEKKDEYMTSSGETFRIDHFAIKGGLIIKTLGHIACLAHCKACTAHRLSGTL